MINVKQITVGLTKKVQLRDFEPAEPRVEFVADVEGLNPEQAEEAAKSMMASVTRVVQDGFAMPSLTLADAGVRLPPDPAAPITPAAPAAVADDMGLPPDEGSPAGDEPKPDTYVTEPQVDHAAPAKIELSDLQEAAAKAAAKIKPAEVKKLIAAFAKSLAEVPEDKYGEVLAVLKGAQ